MIKLFGVIYKVLVKISSPVFNENWELAWERGYILLCLSNYKPVAMAWFNAIVLAKAGSISLTASTSLFHVGEPNLLTSYSFLSQINNI